MKPLLAFVILVLLLASFTNIQPSYPQLSHGKAALTNADTSSENASFLVISDIHLRSGKNMADAYCHCGNSGEDLWDSAKNKIQDVLNQTGAARPKFLIVLGDLPYHIEDSLQDSIAVRQSFDAVYNDVKTLAAQAKIPVMIAPGNNDSYNGDYHALNRHGLILFRPDSTNATYGDNSLADIGCYSVYPLGQEVKLKVIVLNTVAFVRKSNNAFLIMAIINNRMQRHN